jgi:hypothetical protein
MAPLASGDRSILALQATRRFITTTVVLERVDELFDDDPCCNEMNQSQKGLAQFLISCRNTAKLFEAIEESFHLLA